MKKYYSTLNKEKRKIINNIYLKEYKKTELNKRLNRLLLFFILGTGFSIYLFVDAFNGEELNISSLISAITLLIASLVFLIGRYKIKLDVLNKIALKNK